MYITGINIYIISAILYTARIKGYMDYVTSSPWLRGIIVFCWHLVSSVFERNLWRANMCYYMYLNIVIINHKKENVQTSILLSVMWKIWYILSLPKWLTHWHLSCIVYDLLLYVHDICAQLLINWINLFQMIHQGKSWQVSLFGAHNYWESQMILFYNIQYSLCVKQLLC
jgi:hypothetical protein